MKIPRREGIIGQKNFFSRNASYIVLASLALISISVYLAVSAMINGLGFPLDDAWIHHTFAKNFSQSFRWSYQPGALSGGSTGPLWGLILALVYLIGLPPIWSNFFLGFLLLWACGIAGMFFVRSVIPEKGNLALFAGGLIILEWHMVWAALSGMEILPFILLTIALFIWLLKKRENWWFPGLVIGFMIWIRPDGITLLGPALWCLFFRNKLGRVVLKNLLWLMGGVLIIAVPYFLFNWLVAGDIWPNTFYAKQAEYAALRDLNLISRYLTLMKQFVTGVGVLLIPGLVIEIWHSIRYKSETHIAGLLWFIGYIGIYSWRLPVSYQHGRYIMPAMPIGFLLGLTGMYRIFQISTRKYIVRIIRRVWAVSALIVLLVFWGLGGRAYGMDVAVINTEMVKTALWIRDNTPENSVIAAHDIGALGYYADRRIIDLAGLVSPEVIPFIRDESKLKIYLDQSDANYLMTFPSWYPELVQDLVVIFSSGSKYSQFFGMDNMTVYVWK